MKNKREKSWPYYEDWMEIFGKDRATGDDSLDFVEAINGILNKNSTPITQVAGAGNENSTPVTPTDGIVNEDSTPISVPDDDEQTVKDAVSGSVATVSKKKRKTSPVQVEDPYKNDISRILDKTEDAILQIVKQLAPNKDDKNGVQDAYAALGAFPELTVEMRVSIGKKLAASREQLDFFFSLPHEARQVLVTQIQEPSK